MKLKNCVIGTVITFKKGYFLNGNNAIVISELGNTGHIVSVRLLSDNSVFSVKPKNLKKVK